MHQRPDEICRTMHYCRCQVLTWGLHVLAFTACTGFWRVACLGVDMARLWCLNGTNLKLCWVNIDIRVWGVYMCKYSRRKHHKKRSGDSRQTKTKSDHESCWPKSRTLHIAQVFHLTWQHMTVYLPVKKVGEFCHPLTCTKLQGNC